MQPQELAEKYRQALFEFRHGRNKNAVALCATVLEHAPKFADAFYLLGRIGHASGQLETAKELLERAIALDGGTANFHYVLGLVCEGLDDAEGAVQSFLRTAELCGSVVRDRPEDAPALFLSGLIAHKIGQHDVAWSLVAQARALDASLEDIAFALARIARARGREDDALSACLDVFVGEELDAVALAQCRELLAPVLEAEGCAERLDAATERFGALKPAVLREVAAVSVQLELVDVARAILLRSIRIAPSARSLSLLATCERLARRPRG